MFWAAPSAPHGMQLLVRVRREYWRAMPAAEVAAFMDGLEPGHALDCEWFLVEPSSLYFDSSRLIQSLGLGRLFLSAFEWTPHDGCRIRAAALLTGLGRRPVFLCDGCGRRIVRTYWPCPDCEVSDD